MYRKAEIRTRTFRRSKKPGIQPVSVDCIAIFEIWGPVAARACMQVSARATRTLQPAVYTART